MKKTKLIVLTMVIAMMLIGAGYAAWTETLEINTTVNTGDLDVYFSKARIGNQSREVRGSVNINENNKRKVSAVLENLYPGAEINTIYTIQNDSTIPVKLSEVVDTWKGDHTGLTIGSAMISFKDASGSDILFVDNSNRPYAHAFNKDQYANTELPVGGSAQLNIRFTADDDIKESKTYKLDMEVIFKQFNK